ncbi:MAG TPA: GGDEF domain-containing protein [Alphaproteobacteria bacterium]|nr:GGDEF domain-containing protein [Alphaproteobacteria bacterium]
MKIRETRGAPAIGSTRPARAAGGTGSATESRPIQDTVSVLGIPASEMTPKVQQAIMTLVQEVESLRQELARTHARLTEMERLADEDSLAPIPNRRAFVRELTRMISFTERYGGTNSLIYFDVNGLKEINDKFGHSAGDALLVHVARLLTENVRESDMVARLGGDEFGVLLAQAKEENAHPKAASLAKALEDSTFVWDGNRIPVHAAYGVYSFEGGVDVMAALDAADRAMYERKRHMKKNAGASSAAPPKPQAKS